MINYNSNNDDDDDDDDNNNNNNDNKIIIVMTNRRKIGTHKWPPRKNGDLLMAQTKELRPTND